MQVALQAIRRVGLRVGGRRLAYSARAAQRARLLELLIVDRRLLLQLVAQTPPAHNARSDGRRLVVLAALLASADICYLVSAVDVEVVVVCQHGLKHARLAGVEAHARRAHNALHDRAAVLHRDAVACNDKPLATQDSTELERVERHWGATQVL